MQNFQDKDSQDPANISNSSVLNENSFISQSSSSSKLHKKKKTQDDYEIIEQEIQVGAGSHRKTHFNTQLVKEKGAKRQLFAMSIINKKELKLNGESDSVKNEIKTQKKLNHSHIIRLYEAFEDEKNIYTICEHAKNGTLKQYLNQRKKLKEREAFVFVFQTCIALDYLHKKSIIHCDINPESMLLTEDGNIKLTNFGMSIEGASTNVHRNNQANQQYMAPELILTQPFDFRVDIWSVGIILFEMVHGFPPFKTKEEVLQGDFKFGDISLDAKNLIFSLLKPNSEDRLELLSIFNDPWMMRHQQEFKIDFNQYLYKSSSKTLNPSQKPSNQTAVNSLQTDDQLVYENPFTSPPRKTLPSSNPLTNNEQSYNKQRPNEDHAVSSSNLEISFENKSGNFDKKINQTPSVSTGLEQRRENNKERISSSSDSLIRKSKPGERTSFITPEGIQSYQESSSPKKKGTENKNVAFGGTPQKEREKENIIDNPDLAREWLDSRKADKDLDYSFMPKSLLYSSKTLDQSYSELRRKTQQLETLIGGETEPEIERVSRSSWKNVQENIHDHNDNHEGNNHGLFSKFLSMIGCVQRENNTTKRITNKK